MLAVNVTPLMRLVCLLALAGMPMLVGCTAAVSPTDQTLIREADQLHSADDVRRLVDRHFPPGGEAFELDPSAAREEGGE